MTATVFNDKMWMWLLEFKWVVKQVMGFFFSALAGGYTHPEGEIVNLIEGESIIRANLN